MNCAVNEIFGPTIQGEGILTGEPSIFVRFNGCNLRCCFKGGSICDTAYTSHHPEEAKYQTTDSVAEKVKSIKKGYPNVKNIVFTGGEPMLQQDAMCQIIDQLGTDYIYTVETNGTIVLKENMRKKIDLWSISPKLSNSCYFEGHDIPQSIQEYHKRIRKNYPAVWSYMEDNYNTQIKFVYTDRETEDEIVKWVHDFQEWIKNNKTNRFKKEQKLNILIMPEGEIEEQINRSAKDAVRACVDHGWRYCDRTHIRIWGNKRAV